MRTAGTSTSGSVQSRPWNKQENRVGAIAKLRRLQVASVGRLGTCGAASAKMDLNAPHDSAGG
jgi:hypothetical protein